MILLLEDDPNRVKVFRSFYAGQLIHFDSPISAMEYLRQTPDGEVTSFFLDHDLGGGLDQKGPDGDGIDFVKEFVKMDKHKSVDIIIHSLNPVGSANMKNVLNDHGFDAYQINFITLKEIFLS